MGYPLKALSWDCVRHGFEACDSFAGLLDRTHDVEMNVAMLDLGYLDVVL